MRWSYKRGKHWMVQWSPLIGPLNFGIHVGFFIKYVDIHLPFVVLSFGDLTNVEYPPNWWCSSRGVDHHLCDE